MASNTQTEVPGEIFQIIEKTKQILLNKDVPLYESTNVSSEEIEALYEKAYAFYLAEKYQDAVDVFDALVLYHHKDPKNWMGYAASYQMLKNYNKAIYGYSNAFKLNSKNPSPLIHLFECYFEMQDYPKAIAALESVILMTNNKLEYSEIKKQAESLKETLQKNGSNKKMAVLAPF